MSDPRTNLEILKRSRKKPQVGDVFAMLPPDGKYLFGRVIRTNAMGPMNGMEMRLSLDTMRHVYGDYPPAELAVERLEILEADGSPAIVLANGQRPIAGTIDGRQTMQGQEEERRGVPSITFFDGKGDEARFQHPIGIAIEGHADVRTS